MADLLNLNEEPVTRNVWRGENREQVEQVYVPFLKQMEAEMKLKATTGEMVLYLVYLGVVVITFLVVLVLAAATIGIGVAVFAAFLVTGIVGFVAKIILGALIPDKSKDQFEKVVGPQVRQFQADNRLTHAELLKVANFCLPLDSRLIKKLKESNRPQAA